MTATRKMKITNSSQDSESRISPNNGKIYTQALTYGVVGSRVPRDSLLGIAPSMYIASISHPNYIQVPSSFMDNPNTNKEVK